MYDMHQNVFSFFNRLKHYLLIEIKKAFIFCHVSIADIERTTKTCVLNPENYGVKSFNEKFIGLLLFDVLLKKYSMSFANQFKRNVFLDTSGKNNVIKTEMLFNLVLWYF